MPVLRPALLALTLLLPLAAAAQDGRMVSGQVMVLERMALPDDTVLFVDASDGQDLPRASLRLRSAGAQSPFAFALQVPAETALILRAGLRTGDDVVWLTEPQILAPGAEDVVLPDLRALQVQPMGHATLLQCGTQLAELGFLPDEVRLRFNEQVLVLASQPAGPGALYVARDNPATSLHLAGASATLTVDGAQLSECSVSAPAVELSAGVWNISAIDEKPTIFPSRTELVFFPDGRVSATVGCNRFIGGYRRHGSFLSFGRIASTRMGCAEGLDAQEAAFSAALGRVDGFSLGTDATRLTLTAAGQPVLQARR